MHPAGRRGLHLLAVRRVSTRVGYKIPQVPSKAPLVPCRAHHRSLKTWQEDWPRDRWTTGIPRFRLEALGRLSDNRKPQFSIGSLWDITNMPPPLRIFRTARQMLQEPCCFLMLCAYRHVYISMPLCRVLEHFSPISISRFSVKSCLIISRDFIHSPLHQGST